MWTRSEWCLKHWKSRFAEILPSILPFPPHTWSLPVCFISADLRMELWASEVHLASEMVLQVSQLGLNQASSCWCIENCYLPSCSKWKENRTGETGKAGWKLVCLTVCGRLCLADWCSLALFCFRFLIPCFLLHVSFSLVVPASPVGTAKNMWNRSQI